MDLGLGGSPDISDLEPLRVVVAADGSEWGAGKL